MASIIDPSSPMGRLALGLCGCTYYYIEHKDVYNLRGLLDEYGIPIMAVLIIIIIVYLPPSPKVQTSSDQ